MNEEEKNQSPPSTEKSSQQAEQLNKPSTDDAIAPAETTPKVEQQQIEQSETPMTIGTNNNQLQTKNMEVHAHPHAAHGKKNWKNYFWEFLMLFLAVFCGFLAEYQLEHVIEHQREKQYMRSLSEDLNTDIAQSGALETKLEALIARLDSLSVELDFANTGAPPLIIFKQLSENIGFPDYVYTDRTMQQLKNAGGMRLIRNTKVADSIVNYDTWVRRGLVHQELINTLYMPRLFDNLNLLINIPVLKKITVLINTGADTSSLKRTLLLSQDKTELVKLNNHILYYRFTINILFSYVKRNKESAVHLLSLIKKEYHLN